jgi:DNA-binding Xre family transcriptional regulator
MKAISLSRALLPRAKVGIPLPLYFPLDKSMSNMVKLYMILIRLSMSIMYNFTILLIGVRRMHQNASHGTALSREGTHSIVTGQIVSHLRELIAANDLTLSELSRRAGLHVPNPQIYDLVHNSVQVYKFDILARLCALFGGLPLEVLLEYVPPGGEPDLRFLQREVLTGLSVPYGWIRCWLKDRAAETTPPLTYRQIGQGLGPHKDTVSNLANYRTGGVNARTMAALCARFGGIERVFSYDPLMPHPIRSAPRPGAHADADLAGETVG